jgi:hypothetical protein
MVPTVAPEQLAQVRELRLWHWMRVVQNRHLAQRAASGTMIREYNLQADQHLKFVQVLNDFFPIGDTAEQDAQKEHPTS